ncbi:tetratricopeptide repeat protein [Agarilytica rhodophyticola]|uniref:tetratricopeptide repeat protein n=1 Tax=Agarilytica rhodophyticola TaxID=1737490 RepID=UPI000B34251C|nr:tetratricopeptide repeat protein [Agarilytica rhodophyticola]
MQNNRLYFFFILIASVIANNALAHGQASERLHALDHHIEQTPKDASLYVKRGRIYRDAQQFTQALEDYDTALKLSPKSSEALYWQADTYFLQKDYDKTLASVTKYLTIKPKSPEGHYLLAKAYVKLGLAVKAEKHFSSAIQYNDNPPPQWYLDRGNAQLAVRPLSLERIESGIKEGIDKHGEIVSFISFLIRINKSAKNYSAALSWIKHLPVQLIGTPHWKNEHAEILALSGRTREAISLYRSVMTQIATYSNKKRNLPAFVEENEKARKNISRLESLSVQTH